MKALQTLLETESVQTLISDAQPEIELANEAFEMSPQIIRDYIHEHLSDFLVVGNVQATYENMVDFVAEFAEGYLSELTDLISGNFEE